jgi:hypothetical protein
MDQKNKDEEIDKYYLMMKRLGLEINRKSVCAWLSLMKEISE